ncbi:calcium/calmodulin-dependent 3',5'-cyclic nucleotide phosphodiesterase 1C [Pelomyxa schiedti]|nr:calcium/calmodulin-dependent 3',5'-cyclic nucleotide phosphodiesterase 1C [Pelomyxa schiedti]
MFFGLLPVYYINSSECNLGLSVFLTDRLGPSDPGYSTLMSKIRHLMWGQSTRPNILALSFMSKYEIAVIASITSDGVARVAPWWNIEEISQEKIDVFRGVQSHIGITEPMWTPPLKDPRYNGWKTRLFIPLLQSNITLGVATLQLAPNDIMKYIGEVSELMPYKGYSMIVSSNGTILALPEKGWQDWSLGNSTFNFTQEMNKDSFDPMLWNIFQNEEFTQVGDPIRHSITAANGTALASGTRTTPFRGEETIISWNQIETANWIVISVTNKHEALRAQETALIKVITMSCIMGFIVLTVSVSIAIYLAVRRQYSHLSNKVADLHMKLERAESKINKLTTTGDDAAGTTLTSGLGKVTALISRLVESPSEPIGIEDVEVLKTAQVLLMTRNFATIKLQSDLTENQHQFILDCGMQVDERKVRHRTQRGSGLLMHRGIRSTNSSFSGALGASRDESWEAPEIIPEISEWSFNIFTVDEHLRTKGDGGNVLSAVGFNILSANSLLPQQSTANIELDMTKFFGFTNRLKEGYSKHANPYHNCLHAADVTQAMHVLLKMACEGLPEFAACLSPLDKISCVLAALAHDYQHPGLNSNFLKETLNPIYVQYGDSVLERMHAATALKTLYFRQSCRALSMLSPEDQFQVHSTMMSLILATDMAKHIDIIETMKSLGVGTRTTAASLFISLTGSGPDEQQVKTNKLLVLKVLMKIADLSNVIRDWPVCQRWTYNLVNEFKHQGEEEKLQGIPTSKFMDGSTTPQEMQNTFIPLIVIPLLKTISSLFPNFSILEQRAWDNLERWRSLSHT